MSRRKFTPEAAARLMKAAAKRLPREVRKAERETTEHALIVARQLSLGPYTTKMLREMGHPYAKRDPRPPQDPAIINIQSGLFYRSWKIAQVLQGGDKIKTALTNTAYYWKYLAAGTKWMITRPILARVAQIVSPTRRKRLREALARAMSRK